MPDGDGLERLSVVVAESCVEAGDRLRRCTVMMSLACCRVVASRRVVSCQERCQRGKALCGVGVCGEVRRRLAFGALASSLVV